MSRRSGKKYRPKGDAKPAASAEPRKRPGIFRLRRVTLAAAAACLTLVLVALLGGRQPPRVSLVNRTGEPLSEVRLDYPGGHDSADRLPDRGSVTWPLEPAPVAEPAGPAAKFTPALTLSCRLADGSTIQLRASVLDRAPGAHDIFLAVRQPAGGVAIIPRPKGVAVRFRDIIRRFGIDL